MNPPVQAAETRAGASADLTLAATKREGASHHGGQGASRDDREHAHGQRVAGLRQGGAGAGRGGLLGLGAGRLAGGIVGRAAVVAAVLVSVCVADTPSFRETAVPLFLIANVAVAVPPQ